MTRKNLVTSTLLALSLSLGLLSTSAIAASKEPTPKPTATKKPLTASEKAFIKNQKEKAKATKRTGVYPNTAN